MSPGGRTPQVSLVQPPAVKKHKGNCDKCGRDNHATENCRIPEKDLKCEHHGSTGSHMTMACHDKKRGSRPPSPSSAGSKSGSPSRNRSRTRSPKFGRGTPRHGSPTGSASVAHFTASVAHFMLPEERLDLGPNGEIDNDFFTPPGSPVLPANGGMEIEEENITDA